MKIRSLYDVRKVSYELGQDLGPIIGGLRYWLTTGKKKTGMIDRVTF